MRKFSTIISISRLKDTVAFTVPIILLGYALGAKNTDFNLAKLLIGIFANLSAVSFAFIINEAEDAEDDGKKINTQLALLLYALLGTNVLLTGLAVLILGFLYSWRKVRLKAYPLVDILSHCLMLGGLLFLSAFYIQGKALGQYFIIFLIITLISVYGQIYNQVRDFTADKKAGLKNTSILINKAPASIMMYTSLAITIILILYSFYINILPLWMLVLGLILSPVALLVKGKNIQKRDEVSGVPTNSYHFPFLVLLNMLSLLLVLRNIFKF